MIIIESEGVESSWPPILRVRSAISGELSGPFEGESERKASAKSAGQNEMGRASLPGSVVKAP